MVMLGSGAGSIIPSLFALGSIEKCAWFDGREELDTIVLTKHEGPLRQD